MQYTPKKARPFNEELEFSHSWANAPWWESVYRKAFGGFRVMTDIRQDGWCQRSGVDRIVILNSGKILKIDEKVARAEYPTFPLERWSAKETRSPGWVQKPMDADYIAYAEAPTGKVWLFPVPILQQVWKTVGRDVWVNRYPSRDVPNDGYTTVVVPVPKAVVLDAIKDALLVQVESMG